MIMNCIPWPCSQQGKKKVARAICIVTPNLCQNDLRPRNRPSPKARNHPVLSFTADEVWDTRHLGSPGKALNHTHTHLSVHRPASPAQQRAYKADRARSTVGQSIANERGVWRQPPGVSVPKRWVAWQKLTQRTEAKRVRCLMSCK